MIYTPENITHLNQGEVFVFGSNYPHGRHGLGAAKLAVEKFGAVMGKGEGLYGQSYAIPTKDENIRTLPLSKIQYYVDRFYITCKYFQDKFFWVTAIGTGLAGLSAEQIAPMFEKFIALPNVALPREFVEIIYNDNQPKLFDEHDSSILYGVDNVQ